MFLLGSQPDHAPAVWEVGRWWTYGELTAAVRERVAQLVGPKKLIFLFCRLDLSSITWYLAAIGAGHAVALLDAGLAPEFIRNLVDLYQPEIVLGLDSLEGYTVATDGALRRTSETQAGEVHPDLALLLSTSGSTGSPKFVRLTRANVEANAQSISQALGITSADRAVTSLPIHYSFGLSVLNTHLMQAATLVVTSDGLTAKPFWDTVREQGCTSFAGVPYTYQLLRRLKLDELNVPCVNTLIQAGGKLNQDLVKHFAELMRARGGRFFVMYGQTEATARIAILPADQTLARPSSVGLPIPGGTASILDGDTETTVPDVTGELIYRGPNVMMGYATTRADLAQGDTLGGRLATGDLARIDEDGYLYIAGRAKRDAKIAGIRINLDEVEALLRAYATAAVVYKDERLQVFYEQQQESAIAACRVEVPAKLRIHHSSLRFHPIEKLPVTSSGKIDYQALTELAK